MTCNMCCSMFSSCWTKKQLDFSDVNDIFVEDVLLFANMEKLELNISSCFLQFVLDTFQM